MQTMPAITWSGATFSFKDSVRQGEFGYTQDLTGTVSADGQTLLSATYTWWRLDRQGFDDNTRKLITARMVLSNVPLPSFAKDGPDVQKYVTSIEYKYKYTNLKDPSKNSEKTYVSGDWSAPKTRLFVAFTGYP
ncbi:MAG: hypothetical protein Q7T26_00850 [Dehalococcoidia bacterium]|nr:hypothetical protein [Dehalococcoidia bacterium]